MELIQNWSTEHKQLLVDCILNILEEKWFSYFSIDLAYSDIVVAGSRIHGGFKPNSDIDVLVFIKEQHLSLMNVRLNGYLETVPNIENKYGNFRVNIKFEKSSNKFGEPNWDSNCGLDYPVSYDHPKYSLITGDYYYGNLKHIEHHKKFRKLMRSLKGINLPFDDFWKENLYLYE
tara:strand:+ start:1808 stop:2332 length:525 start_codon:yes stop_codon:yes gene_type:complete